MHPRDLLELALDAPRRHRLRSVLSLAGIAIGVAAVLVLTSLGEGARRYVEQEFMGLGANVIAVLPGKVETTGAVGVFGGTTHDLTLDDALALPRRCPSVRAVAPVALGEATLEYGAAGRTIPVLGTTASFLEIRDFRVAAGRGLPADDPHHGERICVIGPVVRDKVFGTANPLGARVRLGTWRFRVVGVLAPKGRSLGVNLDDVVLVPVQTAMAMFDRTSLFRILAQAANPLVVEPAREEVRAVLRERHQGEEDFTLMTPDAMLRSFNAVLRALTAALGAIATISLFVAGIGIMNVMLVSVSERTGEIGLLKALGARRRQLLRLFLLEAALLATAGTLAGMALGGVAVRIVTWVWSALPARVHLPWLIFTVCVAVGVGLVFGILPARRAARVDPVQALSGRV